MDTSRNPMPLFHAAMVSVGVNAPGSTTTPCFRANSVHGDRPVEMRIGDPVVTSVRLPGASLLPHIDDLRSVTVTVAVAVAGATIAEGLAGVELTDIDLELWRKRIDANIVLDGRRIAEAMVGSRYVTTIGAEPEGEGSNGHVPNQICDRAGSRRKPRPLAGTEPD
jgi:hypothetical protein